MHINPTAMKIKKLSTAFLVVSLSMFFFIQLGCKKSEDPVTSDKYLTLGVILPMDQEKGTLRENALRTAIDEVNENGGVGDGYEIRLVVESSEGSDRKAAAALAAEEIITKSNYLIGFISSFSSSSSGIIEEVVPNLFPIISGSATASSLSGISPYFQRLCAPDPFEANILVQQAVEYGINSVAIAVEEGDQYSEELANAFQNKFTNGTVTKVSFTQGDPNYATKINELLMDNPDGIFISMLNSNVYIEFLTMLGNINNAKSIVETSFILCDGLFTNELFQAPIEYMIGEVNGHPKNFGAFPSADTSSAEYAYFSEKLMEKYDQEVASYNAQFYDIGFIYALAIQRSFTNVDVTTINAFKEMVSVNIRPVSGENSGDIVVSPSQGWQAMKSSAQSSSIDYNGASGNCNIDSQGNTITPYSVFKVVKQDQDISFEIIKIIP